MDASVSLSCQLREWTIMVTRRNGLNVLQQWQCEVDNSIKSSCLEERRRQLLNRIKNNKLSHDFSNFSSSFYWLRVESKGLLILVIHSSISCSILVNATPQNIKCASFIIVTKWSLYFADSWRLSRFWCFPKTYFTRFCTILVYFFGDFFVPLWAHFKNTVHFWTIIVLL